jgi:hypothetical protein
MEELEQMQKQAESYERLIKMIAERLRTRKYPLTDIELALVMQVMLEVTILQLDVLKKGLELQ